MTLKFTIPGQPVGKGRPRVGRVAGHVRMYTPEKTASYESKVALSAHQAMAGAPILDGPCAMAIVAVFPIPKSWTKGKQAQAQAGKVRHTGKPDLDNLAKSICDGMNGVVFKDDAQVVSMSLSKRYGDAPGVDVLVEALDA